MVSLGPSWFGDGVCDGIRAAALSCARELVRARRWVVGAEDGAGAQEVP